MIPESKNQTQTQTQTQIQNQNASENIAFSQAVISFYQAFNIHLLKYLGVGLLSGSLVHAGTLGGSTAKYIFFIILGVISIVAGHLLELKAQKISVKLNWLILAIIIAFGTGMLGGSIQHYFDSPQVASFLFAGGFVLTFVGLLLQNYRPVFSWQKIGLGLFIAFLAYVFLSRIAPLFIPQAFLEGGHHHGAPQSQNHNDHTTHNISSLEHNKLDATNLNEPSEENIAKSFDASNISDAPPMLAKEPENEAHDHSKHDHSKHNHSHE